MFNKLRNFFHSTVGLTQTQCLPQQVANAITRGDTRRLKHRLPEGSNEVIAGQIHPVSVIANEKRRVRSDSMC